MKSPPSGVSLCSSSAESSDDDYSSGTHTYAVPVESPRLRNVLSPILGEDKSKGASKEQAVSFLDYCGHKMRKRGPVQHGIFLWMVQAIIPMASCYIFYTFVNQVTNHGYGSSHRAIALGNAHLLVWLEQTLGLLQIELAMVDYFVHYLDNDALMCFFSYFYLYAHVPLTVTFCVSSYRCCKNPGREENLFELTFHQWKAWRNAVCYATATYCLMSLVFPCAPPRMLPEYGFVDVTAVYTSLDQFKEGDKVGVNHYAAVPSMHFGYAAFVGIGIYKYGTSLMTRMLGLMYTAWVLFLIVVTGNHFFLDAAVAGVINYVTWVPFDPKPKPVAKFGDGPVTQFGSWLNSKFGRAH